VTRPEPGPTVDVVVAAVVRAHGVHGEVLVSPRTDEPERRFLAGARLRVAPGRAAGPWDDTRLTVAAARPHQGRWRLAFEELGTRTQAEMLVGALLLASVDAAESPADPEEYYDRQLVGLRVLRHDGTPGGTVVRVEHPGVQDLLVVATDDATERLVPFVAALVPSVDLAAGTVRLADVTGLLEDAAEAVGDGDSGRDKVRRVTEVAP